SADAVVYNPAGVTKMEDGLYVNLSNQYILKDYSHTVDDVEYNQDTPSYITSLFGLYKQARWAGFVAFYIPCGGGKVEYEEGSATTLSLGQGYMAGINALAGATLYDTIKNHHLEAEKIYYGFTLGGAYALNDMVSVSIGARYIDAQKETEGSVTISPSALGQALGQTDRSAAVDYEETADGWAGIVGINIAPTGKLNIGLRYETNTRLDFETEVDRTDLPVVTDGAKARRDLPALFGLGAAYTFMPNLKLEASFVYYLNEEADWNGAEDNVDNGYDVGVSLEYTLNPKLKGSLGYLYTETGIDPDYMAPEQPELDAHTVGVGFAYGPLPTLNLNLGLLRSFYSDETTSSGMKLEKKTYVIAFGIQYKFK
ncbi:MAG TPA: hypothetical protein ENG28_01135, partial [Deltaproteobacteria bacterium]|nr:hypothetical protein [Deltaproteobacteria bacterium]